MRLCGLDGSAAFIDRSYLHFSGFADNEQSRWDEALCQRFDLEIEKLPKIVESHTVIGEVVPDMAEKSAASLPEFPWWRVVETRRPVFYPAARPERGSALMWPEPLRPLPPPPAHFSRTCVTKPWAAVRRPRPVCGIRMPISMAAE